MVSKTIAKSVIFSSALIFGLMGTVMCADKATPAPPANKTKPLNLTSITWEHAVNSQKKLDTALQKNVDMLEADVVLGTFKSATNQTNNVPIMAHPPANESDLSLSNFLTLVSTHNQKAAKPKGVKLDFKSTEALESSIEALKQRNLSISAVWLNADILNGPGTNASDKVVNPSTFFNRAQELASGNSFSLGWTTKLPGNKKTSDKYNATHIDEMVKLIKDNRVENRHITFAVQAAYAANSVTELQDLLSKTNKTNNATLTIWSHDKDDVDVAKLKALVHDIGVHRIYLDVPEKLSKQINSKSMGIALNPSLINFTIISLLMTLLSVYLKE